MPSVTVNTLFNIALIGLGLFLLIVLFFQWLWNITIPDIFRLRKITFWEAFRLLLLAWLIFGGAFLRFNTGG